MNDLLIRTAGPDDLADVLAVERVAFGEESEAELTHNLLADPSAAPVINLLAFDGDRAVGHVLFTSMTIERHPDLPVMLLAPLAVVPDRHKQGIGGALTREALQRAREACVGLVLVLGHPDYYPRHGFQAPAEALGFGPPYPIPAKDAKAWMVQELTPGHIGTVRGPVRPADALLRPEYWRE